MGRFMSIIIALVLVCLVTFDIIYDNNILTRGIMLLIIILSFRDVLLSCSLILYVINSSILSSQVTDSKALLIIIFSPIVISDWLNFNLTEEVIRIKRLVTTLANQYQRSG